MIRVLITGIGCGGSGEQVYKALKMSGMELYIVGTDTVDLCVYKDQVNAFYLVDPAHSSRYQEQIFDIVRREKIQALFPGSEPELQFLNMHRDFLQAAGVYLGLNSYEVITLCMNKFNTYTVLANHGIQMPPFAKIDSMEDCEKADFFPMVLKPNTGSGGSSHVYLAFHPEERNAFARYMLNFGLDIVAQQYVESPSEEYTIGVSSAGDQSVMGCIILKRMLGPALSTRVKIDRGGKRYVISSGVSQGAFIHDENISRQAIRIAQAVGSKGPLNIQARVCDGILYTMEINPRLSGTTSLRAMAGYNEPENMLRAELLGEQTVYDYQDAVVMRRLEEIRL